MIRRRLLGVVAALALLVGLSACAVPSSEAADSATELQAPDKYGFAVLYGALAGVETDAEGGYARIYAPLFTDGGMIRVFEMSAGKTSFGDEICTVLVTTEVANARGHCELIAPEWVMGEHGSPKFEGKLFPYLDGVEILLTGQASGLRDVDVVVWPTPSILLTGERTVLDPVLARLSISVPAASE